MAKKPPMKPVVTTGKAANKTAKSMVAASKAGKGTLAFTPKKKPCK